MDKFPIKFVQKFPFLQILFELLFSKVIKQTVFVIISKWFMRVNLLNFVCELYISFKKKSRENQEKKSTIKKN